MVKGWLGKGKRRNESPKCFESWGAQSVVSFTAILADEEAGLPIQISLCRLYINAFFHSFSDWENLESDRIARRRVKLFKIFHISRFGQQARLSYLVVVCEIDDGKAEFIVLGAVLEYADAVRLGPAVTVQPAILDVAVYVLVIPYVDKFLVSTQFQHL